MDVEKLGDVGRLKLTERAGAIGRKDTLLRTVERRAVLDGRRRDVRRRLAERLGEEAGGLSGRLSPALGAVVEQIPKRAGVRVREDEHISQRLIKPVLERNKVLQDTHAVVPSVFGRLPKLNNRDSVEAVSARRSLDHIAVGREVLGREAAIIFALEGLRRLVVCYGRRVVNGDSRVALIVEPKAEGPSELEGVKLVGLDENLVGALSNRDNLATWEARSDDKAMTAPKGLRPRGFKSRCEEGALSDSVILFRAPRRDFEPVDEARDDSPAKVFAKALKFVAVARPKVLVDIF